MEFQEWLLNEISWHNFPEPIIINDILADAIDFHFEDWKKGANPKKTTSLIPAVSPSKFINDSFSAPLWDNGYINVNKDRIPDVGLDKQQWAAIRKFQAMPSIQIEEKAKYQVLPIFWFDFASLYLNGEKVKEQMWPRDTEQADVDTFSTLFQNPQVATALEPDKKPVPR